jgi:GNAT superfamily N-acetyltransferase
MSGVRGDLDVDETGVKRSGFRLRAIDPEDGAALVRFHSRLVPESVRRRYFYPHLKLSSGEVTHLTHVDGRDRAAFVIVHGSEIVAVARYNRLDDPAIAEVAFVVADEYQHHGIAAMLLRRLVRTARIAGITQFCAEVLAENAPMMSVFYNAGFPISQSRERDVVELTLQIGMVSPTAENEPLSDGTSQGHAPDQASSTAHGRENLERAAELLSSVAHIGEAEPGL